MYVHSMTGYASVSTEIANKRVEIELRSVNHRFCDVQFKIPEDLRFLESNMREQITNQVARGKIECRLILSDNHYCSDSLNLNHKIVQQLTELNHQLRKKHKDLAKLSVADILKFPGVLSSTQTDHDTLARTIEPLLNQALNDLIATRKREGKKLQQHILERLDLMEAIIGALEELFPQLLNTHLERCRRRLNDAVNEIDEDRLKQEFVLYMQKADVDEEFNRLRTHINEVRRIVTEQKGSIGKRLDFLMQELNREANTLGSKAIASECTQVSVELKVLIEQMREQVQNIE